MAFSRSHWALTRRRDIGPATLGPVAPELTRRQNFSVRPKRQPGAVLARLICTRCRADTKSVLRCRACGALCPTSKFGPALLSPSALACYVLVLVVVVLIWFA